VLSQADRAIMLRLTAKGMSTPGNKVAENGNKLLPKTATNCCPKRQHFRSTYQSRRFWQQFVAWCGPALSILTVRKATLAEEYGLL